MAKDDNQNRNNNQGGYHHQGQYQQRNNYGRNNYDNTPEIEIPIDLALIDAADMVKLSEQLGKSFTSINTNQIRNIYSKYYFSKN